MSWLGYVASSLASLLNMSQVPFAFSGKATTVLPYLNTLCVCVLLVYVYLLHPFMTLSSVGSVVSSYKHLGCLSSCLSSTRLSGLPMAFTIVSGPFG